MVDRLLITAWEERGPEKDRVLRDGEVVRAFHSVGSVQVGVSRRRSNMAISFALAVAIAHIASTGAWQC